MPESPGSRNRKVKANAGKNRSKGKFAPVETRDDPSGHTQDRSEESGQRQPVPSLRPVSPDNSDTEDELKDNEALEPEDKLVVCLVSCLTECSRQRLRALHMTLRHYGNVENRVTVKDFQTSLQANQIKLTPRVLAMITEIFEDSRGIDYERLYQCMARAHLRTGRDSIKASNRRNDLKHRQQKTVEEVDQDFLRRLEEQIVKEQTYFDMDLLRSEFYKYDYQGLGKMNKEGAYLVCCERTPLYGALLKNLINRCDEDKDNKFSWPLFLSFLDNAQKNAWEKYPELSSLPQKGREQASVRIRTPEPIDELSSTTKSMMVNKLLKKNPSSMDVMAGNQEFKLMSIHRQVVAMSTEEGANPEVILGTEEALTSLNEMKNPPKQSPQEESMDLANQGSVDSDVSRHLANEIQDARSSQSVHGKKISWPTNGSGQTCIVKGDQRQNKAKTQLHSSSSQKSVLEHGSQNSTVPDALQQDAAGITQHNVIHEDVAGGRHDVEDVTGRDVSDVTQHDEMDAVEGDSAMRDTQLHLEWIYGYCNQDRGRSLGLLASGEIIYYIASNIIMYNRQQHQQRHYRDHTENIQCLAVHSEGILVASAQSASLASQENKSQVHVWRSDSLQRLHVLEQDGVLGQAVVSLCFMPGHDTLVCVGDCGDKKLSVWCTSTGALKAHTSVTTDLLCDLEFNPWMSENLVTCGREHLVWWAVSRETGEIKTLSQPSFDTYLKGQVFTCLCHNQRGDVITADSHGGIHIWGSRGSNVTSVVKHGHQGPITDLLLYHNHLLSAGKDGAVNCWNLARNLEKESTFQLPKSEGGIRSLLVLPGTKGSVLIIGTTLNSLIHVTLNQSTSPLVDIVLENVPITQGHTGDLRGINNIQQSFLGADIISASTDGLICKVNSASREAVWKLWMRGYPFACVDTSQEGDQIFLGTKDGKLVILKVIKEDMTVVETLNKKICNCAVHLVSLSPDGNMVAAVGADMEIYVYKCLGKNMIDRTETWTYVSKVKSQKSKMDSISWSRLDDGYQMRTSYCLQDEQSWKLPSCAPIALDKGHTTTKPDFFQSFRSKLPGQPQVTCAALCPGRNLVAMGTRDGHLRVMEDHEGTELQSQPTRCHQNICHLCFTTEGRRLLTVGGADVCIMQWKIV